MLPKNPLLLVILDGFGCRDASQDNAISCAKTPQWDHWWQTQPHALLEASGDYVGLPDKQMGNSEVGHMHIGAGRVIYQDLTRIQRAIKEDYFKENPALLSLIRDTKASGATLHIMGLLSAGGVHSHEDHLFATLALCHAEGLNHIQLHLFLDGRDTPPKSALESIKRLEDCLKIYPVATIASLSGRYFAMDRDHRWDRTASVYNMLTNSDTPVVFDDAKSAIEDFYTQSIRDEFIRPTPIGHHAPIQDGDAIFFFNFRADRARQLTEAFIKEPFTAFLRRHVPRLSAFVTMTPYAAYLPTTALFTPQKLTHTLGELIAESGLKQLRIAETEKYAHVTFFFNGGNETPFLHEDRLLIPSPQVATYDEVPEMSAPALTKTLIEAIETRAFDVIIANFANADMVGHTGNFDATVKAIECLDTCLQQIGEALNNIPNSAMLITADHGNAEAMFDRTSGQAHTAHTHNPVPFLYVGDKMKITRQTGSLLDVAPTMLHLLNITKPPEMTGQSLLTPITLEA